MAAEGGPIGAIIVLGMHRSGTSVLTRGLATLGIALGDNLKPPVAGDNAKGFFEDWKLSIINDDILALNECGWDSLLVPTAPSGAALNELKLKAIAAINDQFGDAKYFAFKDPRTCRTLPFWQDVLRRENLRPFYVIAFRNPMAVASSLEARNHFPRIRSHYLWLLHTINAVRLTEGESRVFVEYDDLIADPKAVLERIRDLIGDPDVKFSSKNLLAYQADFVEEASRHYAFRPTHVDLDSTCPAIVRQVYEMCRAEKAANGEPSENDWAPIYAAFDFLASFSELPDLLDRASSEKSARIDSLLLDFEKQKLAAANAADQVSKQNAERIAALGGQLEQAREDQSVLTRAVEEAVKHEGQARDVLAQLRERLDREVAKREAEARDGAEHLQARLREEAAKQEAQAAAAKELLERSLKEESQRHETELEAFRNLLEEGTNKHEAQAAEAAVQLQKSREIASAAQVELSRQLSAYSALKAKAVKLAEHNKALSVAIEDMFRQAQFVHRSSSWRLTRPIRSLKRALLGEKGGEWIPRRPPVPEPPDILDVTADAYLPAAESRAEPFTMSFFTICSRNFLAFARTLYDSLREQYGDLQFFVALCDAPDQPFEPAEHPFSFIYLDDLELPQWREMAQRYNITEFNTAIKPFVFQHLMRRNTADYIVYLDPDIIVKSRLLELEHAFASGVSAVLTPHVTGPAENVEVSDVKMLQYGINNLGFIALRNSVETLRVAEWWGRRLIKDCVIRLEEGLFVDQKWADLLPAFLDRLFVLRHPGYNVAYWNIAQRQVELAADGSYYVNGAPLRFAHFSGSNLDDKTVYSRHSHQFNAGNIGDLAKLLDEYRTRIFANGHERFRRIPYAFNWNGASGVNLHTPMPEQQQTRSGQGESSPVPVLELAQVATDMAGGLPQLALKAARAFQSGGIGAVRQGIQRVQEVAVQRALLPGQAPFGEAADPVILHQPKRLLFIDWSTPRPDRDAGSVTAFHLLQILVRLGFDVTFIPSDLEYLGAYTEAVRRIGVRCLHREDIETIQKHLEREGAQYDFVLICRAPIATHYIADIRRAAPRARIILNTSDLHYLRDMREAELSGDRRKLRSAGAARDWELDVIRRCDVTIVMSKVELEILAKELPKADIRHVPLMFVEPADDVPPFSERTDFLFIGGFPHQPNVDAVLYFAREIFPRIRARLPSATWHVVGNAPPPEVIALNDIDGIRMHGFVKDIASLFRSIRLSVAPLRYGAGIKGKLGTSLAFGVPAVATTIAAEGMALEDGEQISIADDPQLFADAVIALHEDEARWKRMSAEGLDRMWSEYSVAAGQQRIAELMKGLTADMPSIEAHEVRSLAEYERLMHILAADLVKRRAIEAALVVRDRDSFETLGHCAVCGGQRTFVTSFMYAFEDPDGGEPTPNWREHLACESCGLPNRLRAGLHVYEMLKPKHAQSVYITEQVTPLFKLLKDRLGDRLVGSEFLGDACPLGATHDCVRNEDLTQLSFENDAFDQILSFDVMEHVSDDAAAFREVFRCLKPGGRFLFSAPFSCDLSWGLIEDLRAAGFENPRTLHYWSRDFGYLGPDQFVFLADKPLKLQLLH